MIRLVLAAAVAVPVLTACENTIRGVGRDAAKTVDATQNAARRAGRAIRN